MTRRPTILALVNAFGIQTKKTTTNYDFPCSSGHDEIENVRCIFAFDETDHRRRLNAQTQPRPRENRAGNHASYTNNTGEKETIVLTRRRKNGRFSRRVGNGGGTRTDLGFAGSLFYYYFFMPDFQTKDLSDYTRIIKRVSPSDIIVIL